MDQESRPPGSAAATRSFRARTALPEDGEALPPGSRREWGFLSLLTAVQVSHVLDFVIIMPLGPQFMRVFSINPAQFGVIVSAYTFAAAVSGLVGAIWIDRFDRRHALLTLFAGFVLGTLACALAPNFQLLVAARVVAGAFGGTMSGLTLAIVGDVFAENRRGMATGAVMSSFSIASVLGVPFGLFLASRYHWHAPFFFLAGLGAVVWIAAWLVLPSIRRHMAGGADATARGARGLVEVLTHSNHLRAFMLVICMMVAGFTVIPYISAYMVRNVGLPEDQLFYIYLVGGSLNFFVARWVGRLADRFGKLRVFTVVAVASIAPILALTHLPPVPLWGLLAVSTAFMCSMSGRFVPAMAMVTSSVATRSRGSFKSDNSSIQSMGSGFAAFVGGAIIAELPDGRLLHFDRVGYLAALATLISLPLARRLRREG
jgi:predicted MFS family arabinose efflux permease